MKKRQRILIGLPILAVLAAMTFFVARWGMASMDLWRARQDMAEMLSPKVPLATRQELLRSGLARLDRAQLLDPQNPDILDQRGQFLYWQALNMADVGLERGRLLEEAAEHYRQALRIRPLWPYTWANLVVAKAEWGIFDQEFRQAVRRTVETGPWEPRVQLQLIRVDFIEQDRIDRRSRELIDVMLQRSIRTQPGAVFSIASSLRQLQRVCPLLQDEILLRRCRQGGWQPQESGGGQ